ncbi:proline racemase family protein [Nitratireductor thuwali]|uniref:Trans-3-hydroxy-L-proline dehydratase n=1 Tax=Nitratireductor thuwali TaxID=2267699 RepID=A0ABY5MKR6_9HYPH|nr:Trans-3-hydroxy-L-proline dehydratase [Nitratireductor thuwali]
MSSVRPHVDFAMLDVMDVEAGGDVGRVVLGGLADLPGHTVADKARILRDRADGLRQILIEEPLGDPSVCINLIVPPAAQDGTAGLIVMGTMGYPDFSGSNAMCAVAALIEEKRIEMPEGGGGILLETPGGLAWMRVERGASLAIEYEALPAFVVSTGEVVEVPGYGAVHFDLVYGGVLYAVIAADEVGVDPARTPPAELARFFTTFLPRATDQVAHPLHHVTRPRLSLGLLAGPIEHDNDGSRAHVAVYMHPGVICHGPTGTGTSALIARMHSRGETAPDTRLRTVSPSGNSFSGTLIGSTRVGSRPAVRTRVLGMPQVIGRRRLRVERSQIERSGIVHLFDGAFGAIQ